jgi:hypothetical protein
LARPLATGGRVIDEDAAVPPSPGDAHLCAVCFRDMTRGETLAAADPCGHVFCDACLAAAVERANRCPKCCSPVDKRVLLFF